MKFAIERTSSCEKEKPPVDGAFLERVDEIDYDLWFIEIDTLQQLVDMLKISEIVVRESYYNLKSSLPTIEIYDSYRE